jgi:hypothetical protein
MSKTSAPSGTGRRRHSRQCWAEAGAKAKECPRIVRVGAKTRFGRFHPPDHNLLEFMINDGFNHKPPCRTIQQISPEDHLSKPLWLVPEFLWWWVPRWR